MWEAAACETCIALRWETQRRIRCPACSPAPGALHPAPPSPAVAPTLQTLPAACSRVLSSLALGPSCFSSGIIAAHLSGAPAWKPKPAQASPGLRAGS